MNYLSDVTTLKLNEAKCISCRKCIEVCPRSVFDILNTAKIINKDQCIECGACKMNCPTKAIEVNHGVGCAIAMYANMLKKYKWLKPFIKDDCC